MSGLVRFNDLAEALRAGFHVYEKIPNGYLVRTRTSAGYALAIVELK